MDWTEKLGAAFAALIILAVIFMIWASYAYHSQLMNECLADGHKLYECHSMLRSVHID